MKEQTTRTRRRSPSVGWRWSWPRLPAAGAFAVAAGVCLLSSAAVSIRQSVGGVSQSSAAPTLDETRLAMGKWIETQQIIAKERTEWQQGKEVLLGRLELVRREVGVLDEKIALAQASVAESDRKRDELVVELDRLKSADAQLTAAVTAMEAQVRELYRTLPEPTQTKLQLLHARMPADPADTHVSAAERFQNVLGILNELNKANNEITVSYEVRTLATGRIAEVKALYIGLAQAYYVAALGEAGIGRPSADGWKWEPSDAIANDVLMALEILQGKHTPAFVPLPVKLQ